MTFLQNRGIVRYVSAADRQQERSVFYIGKKRGKAKMTFYQELQLSSVGSKQLIKNTTDKKEKRRHILIYNFKVYLVMAFCVAVVTLFSKIFGEIGRASCRERV